MNKAQGTTAHIALCGSMSALAQMERIADELRSAGFHTTTPEPDEEAFDWGSLPYGQAIELKRRFIYSYFDTIRASDAVLIVNIKKHGIEGYVGANALMEAACGAVLGKPVFYLHPLGEQSCRLEALAVSAGILDGDPGRISYLLEKHRCPNAMTAGSKSITDST